MPWRGDDALAPQAPSGILGDRGGAGRCGWLARQELSQPHNVDQPAEHSDQVVVLRGGEHDRDDGGGKVQATGPAWLSSPVGQE